MQSSTAFVKTSLSVVKEDKSFSFLIVQRDNHRTIVTEQYCRSIFDSGKNMNDIGLQWHPQTVTASTAFCLLMVFSLLPFPITRISLGIYT